MSFGNPYELEYEVMHMLLELDTGSLQCAHGIIELDVPESKKGNQDLLFRNLVRHLYPEEVEAREDGGFHLLQKLHDFLSKHSKTPKNGTLKPSVNKQGLFVNIKQTLCNNKFINGTIEHQMKTENFVSHPQNNNNMFCLQKTKDFKTSDSIGRSGEKDKFSYTSLAYQIQNGRKDGYMMRNLSSVDSYMLFLLLYKIIIFVMISTTCSKMKTFQSIMVE